MSIICVSYGRRQNLVRRITRRRRNPSAAAAVSLRRYSCRFLLQAQDEKAAAARHMADDQTMLAERRIVVAVDEGEESTHALSWCLDNVVSSDTRDTVVLLYAMAPQTNYGPMDGIEYLFSSDAEESMERYGQEMAKSVIEKAKAVCSAHPKSVKVETKVQRGDARDVICEMVNKLGGDMLVMGSHGYGPIKRAFLGSVSSHCAQKADCPVLIVKKPKH